MESTDEMQTELTSTGGNDAIVATDKQPAPSDTNIVQGTSWFGMSDQTVGIIMLVVAAMIGSVDSIMIEIAEDDGVSSNAITLYASICTLIGTILIDTYFWYVGYPDGDHWFVLIDLFRGKQWHKFLDIPQFAFWVLVSCISGWFLTFTILIAYLFVSDVGDAIAIYDAYPVFIPFFGLCMRSGEDWKHRYFICFTLILIGLILLTQPGFIFGYDNSSVNTSNQIIGCAFSLISSVGTAFVVVAAVMLKKLAYLDLIYQQQALGGAAGGKRNINHDQFNEMSPLNADGGINTNNTNNSNNTLQPMSGDELQEEMSLMSANLEEESYVMIQSKDYIIQNDYALTVVSVEWSAIFTIIECIIFCPMSLEQGNENNYWFFDEFVLFYDNLEGKALRYTIGGSILWYLDSFLYMFGLYKVVNAPLCGLLDITDVFWTYWLSYLWLNESSDTYGTTGAMLIVVSILISLAPWHKFDWIPKSF